MGAHVPFATPFLAAEQAWQSVLQAELQQNPSTQSFDVQPEGCVHAKPLTAGPHWPSGKPVCAMVQAFETVHEVLQQTPSTQEPEVHCVDSFEESHAPPFAIFATQVETLHQ
jgi:hypothetical protein